MGAKTATLEFLGSGTSTGVPIAGCSCPVCRSTDPHDKRLRSSALIRNGKYNLIIDTGPEFRIQCLRAGVMHLDAVLYTHDHADHLHGLDDVRAYSLFQRRVLPVWARPNVLRIIRSRFAYIWNAKQTGGGLPEIELRPITGSFSAAGLDIIPVPVIHGRLDILGYRIGDLAYLTDISSLPESSVPLLQNLGTLIISCVRSRSHPTHLSMASAKRLHARLKPAQTLLTHISHSLSHREIITRMPVDISPAHDGMRVEIAL